jgi:hypothetical protein
VVDDRLVQSWERTRGHLSRAWAELPSGHSSDLDYYYEFLDHNELGLAMEVLAEVGVKRGCSGAVWLALSDAATEMKMQQESHKFKHWAAEPEEARRLGKWC